MSSFQTNVNYELARLYADLSEAKEKYDSARGSDRAKYAELIRDIESVILDTENTRYGR